MDMKLWPKDGPTKLGEVILPTELTGDGGFTFRLERPYPSGGNGKVFEARRLASDGSVDLLCAVKFLWQLDQTRRDRFDNEIRIVTAIDSEYIAAHFDNGSITANGITIPWMAMELGGFNLRAHVQHKGVLRPGLFERVATSMCNGLEHLHAKDIVHRDIKPANFVWDKHGNSVVMLIDLGIAKFVGEDVSGRPLDNFTKAMEFVGPVFFSSPELIAYADDKTTPVDHRSDLFQLGKVLWYLATGRISAGIPSRAQCPFGGALHGLVCDLLNDSPDDRPQSASDVRVAIEAIN